MSKQRKPQNAAIHCTFDKLVPLAELLPHPRNVNQHPVEQVKLLAELIRRHGWRHPILVSRRSGFICAGHGRLLAAQQAKLTAAPVNYQDFEDEQTELEFMLSDNRIPELAETDADLLAAIMKEFSGMDTDALGFNATDVAEMLKECDADPLENLDAELAEMDAAPDPESIIARLAGHVQRLAEQHPDRLRNALAVVIPHGRGHTGDCLVLCDPACSDAAQELRRHMDDGQKSPVACLLNALLPMKGEV